MRLTTTDLSGALAEGRIATDATTKAQADNIWLDECTSGERQQFFEAGPFGVRGTRWDDLMRRHADYVGRYIKTDAAPHTFLPSMKPASLGGIDEVQLVVRLESLASPLRNAGIQMEDLVSARDEDDRDFVQAFLDDWNDDRDARPAFATFLHQVADEVASVEWPEQLRDRLGLAHYSAEHGPEPVALMRYPVSDVLAEATSPTPFTVPSVLDCGPWAHFFPAPRDLSYGHAIALTPCDGDETLVAEFLHSRLTYRPEHLHALGWIRTPAPKHDIAELRDHHLLAVQFAAKRLDFGT
jgi:hypothetical protein